MNTLRLGFSDTYDNAKNFFTEVLSRKYDVVRDDVAPKYLIFGDKNFGEKHYHYDNKKVKKIFFTGENVRPNYFTYNHAITFDHENSPKHYRLPLYVLEMWACQKDSGYDYYHLRDRKIDVEKEFDNKKRFSAYIQSNPRCESRNAFISFMIERRCVDSGGPHFNNIGQVIPRDRALKIKFFNEAFFGISWENGSYPGYVTEKILDSYYSNTIPIYWGSNTIHKDFNKKSFIDVSDFKNFDDMLKYMKHLATTKNEYCDILSQPAFINNIPNEYTNLNSFLFWFDTFVYEKNHV